MVKIHSICEKTFPYELWYSETLSSITINTLVMIAKISKISKSRPPKVSVPKMIFFN